MLRHPHMHCEGQTPQSTRKHMCVLRQYMYMSDGSVLPLHTTGPVLDLIGRTVGSLTLVARAGVCVPTRTGPFEPAPVLIRLRA